MVILFFLIVNTTYYWEGELGLFAIPALMLLVVIYVGLAISLILLIYRAVRERSVAKGRILAIGILTLVLTSTFFRPFGLVNYDKLEGNSILVAKREGVANCMTTLKLRDDHTFRERDVCFGVTVVSGTYHLKNDTIYFDEAGSGGRDKGYYQFAVVRSSRSSPDGEHFDLIFYNSLADTVGRELWITKNELSERKDSDQIR